MQSAAPLPDSVFITSNKPLQRPAKLTTATKDGKAAVAKKSTEKPAKKTTEKPAKKRARNVKK